MFLDHYLNTIGFALYLLPTVVLLLGVPFYLWSRWRGRPLPWRRMIVSMLFAYHLLTAFLLTVMPLPERTDAASFCARYQTFSRPEWVPFEFIGHIYDTLKAFSLSALVYNFEFQAGFFNFLLLLPFGFFLHYLFRLRPGPALACSVGVSLFFELTQLSALYGYYPCPYRLFQVDDLLINATGAMYGYALAPYVSGLPNLYPRPMRGLRGRLKLRRLLAFSIDWGLMALLVRLSLHAVPLRTEGRLIGEWAWGLAIFWLVPLLLPGQTLGKRLLRLRLVDARGRPPSWKRLLLRYSLLLLLPIAINWTFNLYSSKGVDRLYYRHIQLAVNAVWLVVFPLLALLRPDGRGLHDLLAGTDQASRVK